MVGILGDPVDHSLSPRMHNAAFAHLGLDYVYVPFRVNGRGLGRAVRSVRALGLAGVNVTVPYKENVLRHVDELSDAARLIGAANTLYMRDGVLVGDNTDSYGFVEALRTHGILIRRKRVLLIGAGGAARAVVYALVCGGASEVVIANRTRANAERLARSFKCESTKIHTAGLDALVDGELLPTRDVVVNSSSVGLDGGRFLEYDAASTPRGTVHFDLAYSNTLTPFLALARHARRVPIDGRHMLVHQGAAAFKHFTGRRAPVDVMAKAIGIKIPT